MSCAKAEDAAIVKPATTARIVANATAATNAVRSGPPRASASSGAATLSFLIGTMKPSRDNLCVERVRLLRMVHDVADRLGIA